MPEDQAAYAAIKAYLDEVNAVLRVIPLKAPGINLGVEMAALESAKERLDAALGDSVAFVAEEVAPEVQVDEGGVGQSPAEVVAEAQAAEPSPEPPLEATTEPPTA